MLEIRTPSSGRGIFSAPLRRTLNVGSERLFLAVALTPTTTNLTSAPFVLGFLGGAQRLSHLDEVR
jgi:hypothetical protein